ncbi:hypothetical protein MMC20_006668 [Loxospora ochrophaea]|nr:hypothetical protein [Loxospora ochrophaea]
MSSPSYTQYNPVQSPDPVADSGAYSMHPMSPDYTGKTAYADYQGLPPQGPQPLQSPANFDRNKQGTFQKPKRYARILSLISQVTSTLFSLVVFGLMVFIYSKYLTTRGVIVDARNAWPKDPKLWPTIMLLAGSGITLILSLVYTFAFCSCFQRARSSWKLTILRYVIHIVAWLVMTFLYRYEKSLHNVNDDLWGWSCTDEANAIQQEFRTTVNFTFLCNTQSYSWQLSIVETAAKVIYATVQFIIYRKTQKEEKQTFANTLGGAAASLLPSAFS